MGKDKHTDARMEALMEELIREILSKFRPAEPTDKPEDVTYLSTQELLELMEGVAPDANRTLVSSALFSQGYRLQLMGDSFRWAMIAL